MDYPSTFAVDIVSPEKPLFSGRAGQALLPGAEGQFGVLPGHMKLAAALLPGEVTLYGEDVNAAPSRRFYVFGGFAEVTAESCVVLAERAVDLAEHTREEVSAKIAVLREAAASSAAAKSDLEFYEGLLSLL